MEGSDTTGTDDTHGRGLSLEQNSCLMAVHTCSTSPARPEMRSERETRTRSFSPEGGARCERLRQPVRGKDVREAGPRLAGSGLRVAAGWPKALRGCGE
ncbi:hypothetical protein LEMLEM_LOCUS4269 [Lemmus lemmus]